MMNTAIYFAVFLLCGANAFTTDLINRITNGAGAAYNEYPYSVSIQRITATSAQELYRGHICGGALITYQHVLTAASCLYVDNNGVAVQLTASEIRVFAGSASLLDNGDQQNRVRSASNYTIHPDYVAPPASINNIAIITLSQPFTNATAQPIALPVENFVPADFSLCQIASWGAQNASANASHTLQSTTKYVYNQNLCESLYSQISNLANIFPSMLCATSYEMLSAGCYGDMGSVLRCSGGLTGILVQTNLCSASSFPEIYTRVSNYTTWIQSVTGGSAMLRPELTLFAVLAVITAKIISTA